MACGGRRRGEKSGEASITCCSNAMVIGTRAMYTSSDTKEGYAGIAKVLDTTPTTFRLKPSKRRLVKRNLSWAGIDCDSVRCRRDRPTARPERAESPFSIISDMMSHRTKIMTFPWATAAIHLYFAIVSYWIM